MKLDSVENGIKFTELSLYKLYESKKKVFAIFFNKNFKYKLTI